MILFTFMFAPAIAALIGLGLFLSYLIPQPGVLAIVCFAPAMIATLVLGMLSGATVWLLVMRPFVPRLILAEFFQGGPRVPIFSRLCARIFDWIHPDPLR
ncbi:MAG: hypothetical protein H7125_13645 [Proteobacteria bacterium]|nr:hypothetical protein [Burkholderiales bacterium]